VAKRAVVAGRAGAFAPKHAAFVGLALIYIYTYIVIIEKKGARKRKGE
jgi:hypothetical protein